MDSAAEHCLVESAMIGFRANSLYQFSLLFTDSSMKRRISSDTRVRTHTKSDIFLTLISEIC